MGLILFLTDVSRDYGPDYLAHGFDALGHTVIDWPPKPSLHWTESPLFDCDVNIPPHELSETEVYARLGAGAFDMIVMPTLRGTVPKMVEQWHHMGALRAYRDRIVAIDAEDHYMNTRPLYAEALGADPAAYFKRELPIGERWALPLPFGYPEERIVPLGDTPRPARVVYMAEVWPWAVGGLRERIGEELTRTLNGRAFVACTRTHQGDRRVSVADYHAQHRKALVAVSPAGQGYMTNRHLEIVADGCCPVLERPSIEWPHAFEDGTECRLFWEEFGCVEAVADLLAEPAQAHEMARAAQAALRAHHTTRARAATAWEAIHGNA